MNKGKSESNVEMGSSSQDFIGNSLKSLNYSQWLGISQNIIITGDTGVLHVSKISLFHLSLYVFFYANSTVKVFYLTFVLLNGIGPISFLDKIASLDYFLCGVLIIFGTSIWDNFLHERICQIWKVETRLFQSIGAPPQMKAEVDNKHRKTIRFHFLLIFFGCASLGIQFYTDPKNFSFTYSIIRYDTPYLRILFCAHEIIFMGHAWFCNAGSNCMVTFVADNLAATLRQLSQVVSGMNIKKSKSLAQQNSPMTNVHKIFTVQNKTRNMVSQQPIGNLLVQTVNKGDFCIRLHQVVYNSPQAIPKGQLVQRKHRKCAVMKENGDFDIGTLLTDLQHLSLATRIFNDGVAYKLGGLILTGYCQYVASTFLAFQVLRNEGGGIDDIWFYLQDCIASCYHAFRVFNHMSEVLPLAEELFMSIKRLEAKTLCFLTKEQRLRHHTLTKISMKVGPIPMSKLTVLHSMQSLVGYYLCVGLW